MPLPNPNNAAALLEMYYLDARCHLLETAAIFDRLNRAPGAAAIKNDRRYLRLQAALEILQQDGDNRAAAFLNEFSD